MSWEQLAEMRDAGVDIQAHSATHQDLRKPYDKVQKKSLNPEEYEQWLASEVIASEAASGAEARDQSELLCRSLWLHQRPGAGVHQESRLRSGLHRLRPAADLWRA